MKKIILIGILVPCTLLSSSASQNNAGKTSPCKTKKFLAACSITKDSTITGLTILSPDTAVLQNRVALTITQASNGQMHAKIKLLFNDPSFEQEVELIDHHVKMLNAVRKAVLIRLERDPQPRTRTFILYDDLTMEEFLLKK